ncbi:MAG TPA: LuxR family transcriptional regulator [Acidimicrobiales bacterium]|nr:LuxR family transcriptional regulator [Acidimicrobiales bacterium]
MSESAQAASPGKRQVLSRESDLGSLNRFFESSSSSACLVLSGEVGIGKTTLWESGLQLAAAHEYRVLATRTSQAEVAMSFASLADLVEGIPADVLATLPDPQLRALEVALRRQDPAGEAPDHFAIAAGFLSALRALAEQELVLVAVDDVQWLDPSSADSLSFAARRLPADRVRFLITRRAGRQAELEQAIPADLVERLEVAPLSFGATSRLLSEGLGPVFSHRVLRQVHATSHGNPLFALELGRLLVAGGMPEIGAELPVPRVVEDIFGPRVRDLPGPLRRAMLAVALDAGLSQSELSTIVDPLAVEDAIASGLLVVERSRLRPAHPMLAASARQQASARERRDLHLDLASAVGDATVAARHLGLATVGPDAERARVVSEAAELAARRAAIQDAEELGAHALRLTPADAPERADRLLALGRFHLRADDMTGVTELLTARLHELPHGRPRAMAHLLLGDAADVAGDEAQAELALLEAPDDPEVRGRALAKRSKLLSISGAKDLEQAEASGLEAVSAARHVGGQVEELARSALAWARVIRGRSIEGLISPGLTPESECSWREMSDARVLGHQLIFRGEVARARPLFVRLLALADDYGDLQSSRLARQQLCELELRAGDVIEAARQLEVMVEGPSWAGPLRTRFQSLLDAMTGTDKDATAWAAATLEVGSAHVSGWDQLEVSRAGGLAALFERDTRRAIDSLGAVWEHTVREHIDDPGAFPVAPDLVEAMVQTGDTDRAKDVTDRLRRAAEAQQHPWGLASASRCAAVVQLAGGYVEEAAEVLNQAASDYGRLGLNFDRARTLLYLGSVQRRSQKRTAARRCLEDARTQFEQCGCAGWAALVGAELARVSGRRRAADELLTPSERQVVDMAVGGLTNKEIAGRLFVAVNTVEAHLSHAYAKLGVRSRAQLRRLEESAEK